MKQEFENQEKFFDKCGDQWLHPMQYGECFWPVTVEEMYQHFKARLISELRVTSPELLEPAELVDMPNMK